VVVKVDHQVVIRAQEKVYCLKALKPAIKRSRLIVTS
jgi:hypothetical protein